MTKKKELKPLAVSCGTADCENKLHCFHKSKRLSAAQKDNWARGLCVYCGADKIDWTRLRRRDPQDAKNTIVSLRNEWIRNHYWEKELTERVIGNARRCGRAAIEQRVERRIESAVGKPKHLNSWDGRQTPFKGKAETIITMGQHAMACCCRTCMLKWHGIPTDLPLSPEEIEYFKKLVLLFIDARMPKLNPQPEKIAPHRVPKPLAKPPEQTSLPFEHVVGV
ncbi:MAG: DUF4186 family protein [Verrucomicrobiia bacterium]|jgi:hypothetical protein